jgi:hypothetical protein
MNKRIARMLAGLLLLTNFAFIAGPEAGGQQPLPPVGVRPTTFYRFRISNDDGGYLLTANFAEGVANGYTYDPISFPDTHGLGIYAPPPGYTPDPTKNLRALHRWLVIQGGWRNYYYYSTYFYPHGSDYHYQGIAGYVFAPQQVLYSNPAFIQGLFPLHQLSVYYSQDLGFWNGYGSFGFSGYIEPPPNRSGKRPYVDQGIIAAMPPAMQDPQFPIPSPPGGPNFTYDIAFFPPAPTPTPTPTPPPGSCSASQALKNRCAQLGGSWDDETCSCQY